MTPASFGPQSDRGAHALRARKPGRCASSIARVRGDDLETHTQRP